MDLEYFYKSVHILRLQFIKIKFEKIKKLKELINDSKSIVIIPHTSPDGDAIGSCLALFNMLNTINKTSQIISPNKAPDFLNWTPGFDNIIYFDSDEKKCKESLLKSDLVFTLDFNDLNRIGELNEFVEKSNSKIVMIDHHQNPVEFCEIIISRPEICSTAQLIYECIEELEAKDFLNKSCCEAIYLGIMTDTGSFRYPSVTSKTHLILAHLIEMGVEHFDIHEKIFDVNTLDKIQLRAYAIANKFEKIPGFPIGLISMSSEELQRFN